MRSSLALAAALLAALLTAVSAVSASPACDKCKDKEVVPLVEHQRSTPPAFCVRLSHSGVSCSATIIASENGKSLMLSNNHCFARRIPGGWYPRANYPIACEVSTLGERRVTFRAVAVDGSAESDMTLSVVDGVFPHATIGGALPAVGERVEHWGICSGHTVGIVRPLPMWADYDPTDLFRSTCGSCPGDSGAGVFHRGKLVAVNWGKWTSTGEQAGTPIAFAAALALESPEVARTFPRFYASIGGKPTPPVQPPIIVPPPQPQPPIIKPCPPCPPCPPRRPLFPRRPIFRR